MKWLVLRTGEGSQRDAATLQGAGLDAHAVLTLERRRLPWPKSFAPRGDNTLFFITSSFVAEMYADYRRGWPAGATFQTAALAPRTRELLEARSIRVDFSTTNGAAALAQCVLRAGARGRRICYPTSHVGVETPEQALAVELLSRCGSVERHIVYETIPAPGFQTDLREFLTQVAKHEPDTRKTVRRKAVQPRLIKKHGFIKKHSFARKHSLTKKHSLTRKHSIGVILRSPSAVAALSQALPAEFEDNLARAVCIGASTAKAWSQLYGAHKLHHLDSLEQFMRRTELHHEC